MILANVLTRIRQLFVDSIDRHCDSADSSLPAMTQSTGYHKRRLQEDLFNFRFLRNMNISSTELFSDIHTLHKAMKQIRINRQLTKYNRGITVDES